MELPICLTPEGAWVMRLMIQTCGAIDCRVASKALTFVRVNVPIESVGIGRASSGVWWPAFKRLRDFAVENGYRKLGAFEVASYFAGDFHVQIMLSGGGYNRLGEYLGSDIGLLAHVLLPISENGTYENGDLRFRQTNLLRMKGNREWPLFCHLGVAVRLPFSEEQVQEFLTMQAQSAEFMAALERVSGRKVKIPDAYKKAVLHTMQDTDR